MVVGGGLDVTVVVEMLDVEATVAPALASLVQQQAMATRRRHFSGSLEPILAEYGLLINFEQIKKGRYSGVTP